MSPEVVCVKSAPSALSAPAETIKSPSVLVMVGKLVTEPSVPSGIAKIRNQGKFETCPEFPLGSRENPVVGTDIVCPPRPTPVVQVICEAVAVGQNPTLGSIT